MKASHVSSCGYIILSVRSKTVNKCHTGMCSLQLKTWNDTWPFFNQFFKSVVLKAFTTFTDS